MSQGEVNLLDMEVEIPEETMLFGTRIEATEEIFKLAKKLDFLAFNGMASYVLMHRAPQMEDAERGFPSCGDTVFAMWRYWDEEGCFINYLPKFVDLITDPMGMAPNDGKFSSTFPENENISRYLDTRVSHSTPKGSAPVPNTEEICKELMEVAEQMQSHFDKLEWPYCLTMWAYVAVRGGYSKWQLSSEKMHWGEHKRYSLAHRLLTLPDKGLDDPNNIMAHVVEQEIENEGEEGNINDQIYEIITSVFGEGEEEESVEKEDAPALEQPGQ